jgi:acyl transferase domain-containing protein
MTSKSNLDKKLKTNPIAIIGISAIFPQASNKQEYWDNILNKIDSVTDVPESRWNSKDYFDPDPKAEDKSYCKRGGFIPDIDFDPAEFGLPPNLLEATDVSQLLGLVAARDCLEDGGYGDESKYSRENVGVILGMVGIGSKLVIPLMARLQYPVWDKVLKSYSIPDEDRAGIIEKIKLAYPRWEESSFPGSIGNVVAGRIANRFNLGGTNCVVDAACASSLAAIRMAVADLIEGRADMMITGGVDTDNSIGAYLCFSKTPAFSKGEHVRSFDQDSDGMMVGEGIGMVLLKRLEDAERDGDRIYAVIKAIGTSSDGRYKSIYAPRPDGQSLALERAYAEAGFEHSTVGLIEAHGTGTMAGDPAEFQGLNAVFSKNDPQKQHIALGSVKSQIAHTKAAAGVASLIKTALALHNKVLPATINVTKPNPKLGIENSPFYINTEVRPWYRSNGNPRRAGVSSFGFGGTNFHVVLEEFEADHKKAYRNHSVPRVILMDAATPEDLLKKMQEWSTRLTSQDASSEFLNLVSVSTGLKIPLINCRVGFIALNAEEAVTKLSTAIDIVRSKGNEESTEHPSGIYYRKQGFDPAGKVVALFPGQGSQYVNMGSELSRNFPEIRNAFDEMNALFEKSGEKALTNTVYPVPVFDDASCENQNRALTPTDFAQPAIGTFSAGLYRLLSNAGFEPDFTAGHSFGELTALWAASVYSDEDFFFLARSRGKAMAPLADPNFDAGTMLAVKGNVEKIREEIASFPEVKLANWNSNSQVVLAGSKPAVEEVQKALADKGYSVVPLDVAAAFHTPLVGHAQKPFAAAIEKAAFKKPSIKVYSNTTGEKYAADVESIKKTLSGHILNSVLFQKEIETIYSDGGRVFVEIGPKNVLTNLVNTILDGKPHYAIALNASAKKDSDRQYREALTQMAVLGLDIHVDDPYVLEVKPAQQKRSSISLKLNGGLYLSDKTRQAFQNAINGKHALHIPMTQNYTNSSSVSAPSVSQPQSVIQERPVAKMSTPSQDPSVLKHIEAIQNEISGIHQKFLENDQEFSRVFSKLTEQELTLASSQTSPQNLEQINSVLQTLDRSLAQFHQHQAETTRIHEQYLKNQYETVTRLLALSKGLPATELVSDNTTETTFIAPGNPVSIDPVVTAIPTIPSGGNGHNGHKPSVEGTIQAAPKTTTSDPVGQIGRDSLNQALLAIVSEKTGYPSEMLELSMDMEADLGIDSIKRVEILGAMQEKFPNLPAVDPSSLTDLRTLGQIVDYMSSSAPAAAPVAAAPVVAEPAVKNDPAASPVNLDEVTGSLLAIVSEKTGYPSEMLETGMDMEADLGIDSIKRVEILGAMQEKYPQLPAIDPAALSDMRTLEQIIRFMTSSAPQTSAPEPTQPVTPVHTHSETKTIPVAENTASSDELKDTLIAIVSEKTGYPAEMLETDMDMEADLGIDSIKRVEILGAMQEKFPHLPAVDAAALSDMHTLQQIIDSFSGLGASKEKTEAKTSEKNVEMEPEVSSLPRGYVTLKAVPLPDRLSITLPEGSQTLLTDDGTGLTARVAENLLKEGHKVAVLTLAGVTSTEQRALPSGVENITLTDNSETTLAEALNTVKNKYGQISVMIHLDPAHSGSASLSHQEQSIVKSVFLLAKLVAGDLSASAAKGFSAFMTVTHLDGQFGLSQSNSADPVSGGLFGLTKTVSLEWDGVYCRSVDLKPGLEEKTTAEIITSELYDSNHLLTETGYTGMDRFTLVVDQPEMEGAA